LVEAIVDDFTFFTSFLSSNESKEIMQKPPLHDSCAEELLENSIKKSRDFSKIFVSFIFNPF
jgi:hypothetical protein